MKKRENKKTKLLNRYKITTLVLFVMLICVSIVAVTLGFNTKSREEQRYLALFPSLLNVSVWERCGSPSTNEVYLSCEVRDYGVNEQGDPYVIFESRIYDASSLELIDGPYLEKMYYWESETGGFSTAMDKEFKKLAE